MQPGGAGCRDAGQRASTLTGDTEVEGFCGDAHHGLGGTFVGVDVDHTQQSTYFRHQAAAEQDTLMVRPQDTLRFRPQPPNSWSHNFCCQQCEHGATAARVHR